MQSLKSTPGLLCAEERRTSVKQIRLSPLSVACHGKSTSFTMDDVCCSQTPHLRTRSHDIITSNPNAFSHCSRWEWYVDLPILRCCCTLTELSRYPFTWKASCRHNLRTLWLKFISQSCSLQSKTVQTLSSKPSTLGRWSLLKTLLKVGLASL